MADITVSNDVDQLLKSIDKIALRSNLGLGTVAITNVDDYATANQGALADSAQQPLSEGPFEDGDKTKLDGIAAYAEINTIDSNTTFEPAGSAQILNVVSISQLEYNTAANNGLINPSTFYIITD